MQKIKSFLMLTTVIFCLLGFALRVPAATIDVMIVFDTTAKTWVDNNGGMKAYANDAVARLNQAAVNSNINLTFRLVHTALASYTYSKNLSTDLTNLQTGSGNLAAVHQWRDNSGADLVVMMVDTGSAEGWVGQGYILETYAGDPDYAFTVNSIRAVAISHTLTHEIGHNLGCDHSKTQKDSPGPNTKLNSYSAGWYFTGSNTEKYHTIMAYGEDGYGNQYIEAPLFSTPLWQYEGTFAGHAADGDNARTIRDTMNVVAAYRSTVQLYADFAGYGLYQYDGTGWRQINSVNPDKMTASGRILYADFKDYGLYKHEAGIWSLINTVHPTNMLSSDGKLYATFADYGFYKYDGNGWSQINSVNPESMTISGGILYPAFKDYGFYKYDGNTWTQINTVIPAKVVVGE